MEFLASVTPILGIVLMVVAFFLSFIPLLPGPVIPWLVAIVFGFLTGWERFSTTAAIIITILMLISATSDYWRPLLGAGKGGLSCAASLGSIVGGLVGTFVIPIPLLGTLIGCVVGALAVELIRHSDVDRAVRAGEQAARLFAIGYALNIGISFAMLVIFVVSVLTTG